MIGVLTGIVLALAIALIVGGLIMVWTDKGRAGYVQFGNFRVSGGALVCMVIGVLLLYFGINLWTKSGTDPRTAQNTVDFLQFVVPTAHAEGNVSELPTNWKGWMYIGPKDSPSTWVVIPTTKETTLTYGDVWRATGPALVREHYVSDWSGTILDRFIDKPEVVASLARGDCVQILDHEDIGVRSLWAKVEKTRCPTEKTS